MNAQHGSKAGDMSKSNPTEIAQQSRWRSRVPTWLLITVGIALALGAFLALQSISSMIWTVNDVRLGAEKVRSSIELTDTAEIATTLSELENSSKDLSDTVNSFPWSLLKSAPVVGDSVSAVSSMSESLYLLANSTQPVAQKLATANSTTERIAALTGSKSDLDAIAIAATQAADLTSAINPESLRFGLGESARALQESLPNIVEITGTVAQSVDYLPAMLGDQGQRRWLVMLQNPAEVRGSGGLFSGYVLVEFLNGAPNIVDANSRKAVLDDLDIPYQDVLEQESIDLYGDWLGEWASFNLSPDFPTVAKLAAAGMEAKGTPVSGVIAIDPYTVQAVLAGTGKVEHQGVIIDGTNAADFFIKDIYTQYPDFPDVLAKDQLALGLVYASVDSLLKRPLDLRALFDTLPAMAQDGHVKIWSSDPREEAWLQELGLSGDIESKDPTEIVIAINNSTGGKLDAYVDYRANMFPTCEFTNKEGEAMIRANLEVTLTNNAPSGLPDYVDIRLDSQIAEPTSTASLVHVYAPPGARQISNNINGYYAPYLIGTETGRPVWATRAELPQGESAVITNLFEVERDLFPTSALVTASTAKNPVTQFAPLPSSIPQCGSGKQ